MKIRSRWEIALLKTALSIAIALFTTSAQAAVVTLTGGTSYGQDSDAIYLESAGFRYQTSAAYRSDDLFNLHDVTGLLSSVFTRQDGRRFSLLSAELSLPSRTYKTANSPAPDEEMARRLWERDSKPAFLNLGWYGYRKGIIVASWEVFLDTPFDTYQSYPFDLAFANLDQLIVRYFSPVGVSCCEDDYFDGDTPNTVWIAEWSGELFVESVTFDLGAAPSPVPLPAALPLSAFALALLAAARLRRRA